MNVGDIVAVTFRGTAVGQRILNTWHFRCTTGNPISTVQQSIDALLDYLRGGAGGGNFLEGVFLDCQSNEYTLDTIRGQQVAPLRSAFVEKTRGSSGAIIQDIKTPNLSASITKRTTVGTRRGIGRTQVGPLPTTTYDAGLIEASHKVFLQALANKMLVPYLPPLSSESFSVVVYNPGAVPNYQPIFSVLVQDTVRTMRRRSLRLGE